MLWFMSLQQDIEALEAELKAAGLKVDAVLAVAKIDRSTWTRWKNGSVKGARYDTMARVREAAQSAISNSDSKLGGVIDAAERAATQDAA